MSLAARALLFAVRVYQAFFSGLMPSACKFYPSCSHYAAEAVRIHGARRGSWLALRRFSRCHPFTPGGVDLVPGAADFPSWTGSCGERRRTSSLSGFLADGTETRQAAGSPSLTTRACPTKEARS
jgi:hypothetical protein